MKKRTSQSFFMTDQEPALTLRTKAWFFNEVASSWLRANCSLSSETSCQTRMSSVSMVGWRALEESRGDPTWKCTQRNWNHKSTSVPSAPSVFASVNSGNYVTRSINETKLMHIILIVTTSVQSLAPNLRLQVSNPYITSWHNLE